MAISWRELWIIISKNNTSVLGVLFAKKWCIGRELHPRALSVAHFRCSWSVTSYPTSFMRIRIHTDTQIDTSDLFFILFFFWQLNSRDSSKNVGLSKPLKFNDIWRWHSVLCIMIPRQMLWQIASTKTNLCMNFSEATRRAVIHGPARGWISRKWQQTRKLQQTLIKLRY